MTRKDLTEYKRKYHRVRHHAWAGSVLLAILLAVRLFFETSNIGIDDRIIIGIGGILVSYTLIAVVLTYKYSSGLSADDKIVHVHETDDKEKQKLQKKLAKEKAKIEKKKAKAEVKKAKKED